MSDLEGQQLTAAQREALEAELADMEGPQRKAAVDAIATARAFGDLSENFEYHAAKNEQGLLEARITKLRHKLQHAVTVEHTSTDTVGVGSIVEIEDEQGEKMEIEISSVGGVSPDSPLGSALMGAAVGDGVDVPAPARRLARHGRLDQGIVRLSVPIGRPVASGSAIRLRRRLKRPDRGSRRSRSPAGSRMRSEQDILPVVRRLQSSPGIDADEAARVDKTVQIDPGVAPPRS